MSNVSNDLLSNYVCKICHQIMVLKCFKCPNGHVTCNTCIRSVQTSTDNPDAPCPECRAEPVNASRNMVMENFATFMKFPCRNAGCSKVLNIPDLVGHLRTCKHQTFPCPVDIACGWHRRSKNVIVHIRTHPPVEECQSSSGSFSLDNIEESITEPR